MYTPFLFGFNKKNIDHTRITGTERSSVILSQKSIVSINRSKLNCHILVIWFVDQPGENNM